LSDKIISLYYDDYMHGIHVLNIASQSIIPKCGDTVEVMSYEYKVHGIVTQVVSSSEK